MRHRISRGVPPASKDRARSSPSRGETAATSRAETGDASREAPGIISREAAQAFSLGDPDAIARELFGIVPRVISGADSCTASGDGARRSDSLRLASDDSGASRPGDDSRFRTRCAFSIGTASIARTDAFDPNDFDSGDLDSADFDSGRARFVLCAAAS
jgi:hypothetical protein